MLAVSGTEGAYGVAAPGCAVAQIGHRGVTYNGLKETTVPCLESVLWKAGISDFEGVGGRSADRDRGVPESGVGRGTFS